jgi:hypothetical protein
VALGEPKVEHANSSYGLLHRIPRPATPGEDGYFSSDARLPQIAQPTA